MNDIQHIARGPDIVPEIPRVFFAVRPYGVKVDSGYGNGMPKRDVRSPRQTVNPLTGCSCFFSGPNIEILLSLICLLQLYRHA